MLTKTTPSYVNTLRRLIINRVPTLAMEDIEIKHNNSVLYDEVLAHRLGLIPLTTDLSTYNHKQNCNCKGEGCAQCEVKLTLKATGPGVVKASDIKSQDPKIVPVYPDTPIVNLQKEQNIELIATAVLGTGREHSKWSPAHAWFTYKSNIKINDKSKKFEEVKDLFPPQIFNNGKIDKNMIYTPELIDACEGVCDDVLKIEYDDTSFIFHLESWGQLNCNEIFTTAINTLNGLVDEFAKQEKQCNG